MVPKCRRPPPSQMFTTSPAKKLLFINPPGRGTGMTTKRFREQEYHSGAFT